MDLRMYTLFARIKETTSDDELYIRKEMYNVLRDAIRQRHRLGMKNDSIEEMLKFKKAFYFPPWQQPSFSRVIALAKDAFYTPDDSPKSNSLLTLLTFIIKKLSFLRF